MFWLNMLENWLKIRLCSKCDAPEVAGQTDNKGKQEEQLWSFYFEILLNQDILIRFEDSHNYKWDFI